MIRSALILALVLYLLHWAGVLSVLAQYVVIAVVLIALWRLVTGQRVFR